MKNGISIYGIGETLSNYLINCIGEIGSNWNPVVGNGVSQIHYSQWTHMLSIRRLYYIVQEAKNGEVPVMVAKDAINKHNVEHNTNITFKDVASMQLEFPSRGLLSPVADPWIFFRCSKGWSIYDLINLTIPVYHGADLSHVEDSILHLRPYMDLLYIVHPDAGENGVLQVIKSEFEDYRHTVEERRVPEEVGDIYNIWDCVSKFSPENMVPHNYLESEKRLVYTLPPNIEQSIIQEWEIPGSTYLQQDYAHTEPRRESFSQYRHL